MSAQVGFIERYSYKDNWPTLFVNAINDTDSTVIVYGKTINPENSQNGIYVARIDTLGKVIQESFFIDEDEYVPDNQYEILKVENGFIITAITFYNNAGLLLKINDELELIWKRKYNYNHLKYSGTRNYNIIDIDDYYILSLKTLKSSGYHVITILKVNQSGELIWEKDYGTLGNDEVGYFFPSSTDDEIIIYGGRQRNFYSASGSSWGMIYAIDTSGTVIWEHEDEPIGNQQYEPYEYVIRDDEGGWVVSQPKIHRPVKNSESTWSEQSRIRKLDDDFNVVWSLNLENYLGYDLYKNITAISTLESSDIIISGNTPTAVFPGVDGLSVSELAKINSGGNLKWMRYDTLFYGLDKSVLIENNKHIILPSGSIMLCGTITTNSGEYYGFIEKLDKDGCLKPGCRDTLPTEDLPDGKEVLLYPNPATHEISIRGKLDSGSELMIYDRLGRLYLAQEAFDGMKIDVSSWPSGMYFYSLIIDNEKSQIIGKIIIVK
ncbi:MAG: T9SS type A sorting domain-containing protein [Lewinellaceae bacterium]|nr:T9SS type A sorting domain-containing protein [Lewinellaceae bacterium]